MHKRIIICCDGTWNEPESIHDHVKVPTNVLQTVRAAAPLDEERGIAQVVFYNEGVGTGSIGVVDKMIGGGMGAGISRNIQCAYQFLANNYVDGDEIFLFGFSRGAYTARSLAGMLGKLGLLGKCDLRYVPELYEYYHIDPEKRAASKLHNLIQDLPRVMPKIKFIGVWDTVGSLGSPTPILGRIQQWVGQYWRAIRVGFHDCNLGDSVENAFHALAIDERRGPFKPALWNKRNGQRTVQQVWFAGVHSNVGGGYPDCGISDVALNWMLDRAMECGLKMDDTYLHTRINANPLGKLEDSYSAAYKVLEFLRVKPYERVLGEHLDVGEMIHESVLQRICSDVTPLYRPHNLSPAAELPALAKNAQGFITINGKQMPVARERACIRVWADQIVGEITLLGQPAVSCKVIDFSAAHGARLCLDHPVSVGSQLRLNSPLTGARDSIIVWVSSGEVGVRFVA